MDYALATDIATDFIAEAEGFRSKPYWDVNGWAIAYGNHYYADGSAVKQTDTITKDDGKKLLKKVVAGKEQAIRPYIKVPINENQDAALISLAYNCGEGNVRKSHLLELINAQAPVDQIEDQFGKTCVTAKGEYMAELYKRRLSEFSRLYSKAGQLISDNPKTSAAIAIGGALIFGAIIYFTIRIAKTK